jgi:HK97 family phage major capsid protein
LPGTTGPLERPEKKGLPGTTFASLSNADLRKLMRSVLLRARRAGAFVGGPYLIDVLEEIGREGKVPILREAGDGSYRVKGKLFIEDEGMPDEDDSAADAALMAFGDPKTWAVILAGAGIQIATDASVRFLYNQTAFRALGHVDVVRKPGNTWALLKSKAACGEGERP